MDRSNRRAVLRRVMLGAATVLLHGCAMRQPPAAPANTYTAESTYAKLVASYPSIRIASASLPASVRVVRDLNYVSQAGRDLRLDLYLPANPAGAKAPGIVFVHGGGWRVGDREEFAPMAIRMAERGYAAATITYRLADEAPYPAAALDAAAAVRWLRANAARYAVNPDQIAIAGGSAGGQVASLAGVRNSADASGKVQAIVNIDGLSDFLGEVKRLRGDPAIRKPASETEWFGGWFKDRADRLDAVWREASPLTYAGRDSPPVLFIGSGVPRFSVGRDAMVEKLRGAGVASKVVLLPDTPHAFWMFDPWLAPTVDATAAFLDGVFGRK
jgi:acetyl esterase/lipase